MRGEIRTPFETLCIGSTYWLCILARNLRLVFRMSSLLWIVAIVVLVTFLIVVPYFLSHSSTDNRPERWVGFLHYFKGPPRPRSR